MTLFPLGFAGPCLLGGDLVRVGAWTLAGNYRPGAAQALSRAVAFQRVRGDGFRRSLVAPLRVAVGVIHHAQQEGECEDRDDHDGDNVACGSCHVGTPFETTDSVSCGTGQIAPVKDTGLIPPGERRGTPRPPAFGHAPALAGPEDRFVSINNDTIYSIAQVDVSGGPVLLRVPDMAGRYYVLQFVDVWTENFAYVGRRATGTAAGSFLLVPPGWQGDPPSGARVIEFLTAVGTIVGRWACDGPADLAAVQALQRGLSLEPYGTPAAPAGIPAPAAVPAELAFFEQLRTWMQAFPPSAADRGYRQRFAPLGLLDAASPYPHCPPGMAKALTAGADAAREQIETALKQGGA
jgi:Protein of unknown function (DUF1254)